MPDLSNYTGAPLNRFAMSFIRALEAERFTVGTTHQGPVPGQRKTLRIYWGNVYVGQMTADLWAADEPFVCLYRFGKDGAPRDGVAHAPYGFDKVEFAKRYGCAPEQLHVHRSECKSYLWVRDTETAMLLLRDRAKQINDA
jgi:5-methylcytosine-specific restriction protein A